MSKPQIMMGSGNWCFFANNSWMSTPKSPGGKFLTKERMVVLIIMGVFALCSIAIYLYYDNSIKSLEKEKEKLLQEK